jgi:magnesium transporter
MRFFDFRLTMWAQILVLRCTSDVMSISDRLAKSNTEHGEIEMLTAYPASAPTPLSPGGAKRGDARAARKASWLDLLDPTQGESASVESTYGLKLPSREELSEVESSSRISEENGVLFLSIPVVSHLHAIEEAPSPIGFVLSKEVLVTIRYTQLRSFEAAAAKFSKSDASPSSVDAFATVVDEMVDLSADLLEGIAAELDAVSRSVFLKPRTRRRHLTRSNDALHRTLIEVGNAGERLSRIRGSLLGLQRIVPFVSEPERDWIPNNTRSRLKTAQADLLSLTDYETHLSDKVQFLLDAVLGFISTKQNDIFTVLTSVSVIGIPPTLVASIYGMNFKNMPELDWAWGYQFGLALIVLSTILPFLWFKWRGWL